MATVLATGAYLKNCPGLWHQGRWQAGPVHGDLSTPEACAALEATVKQLLARAGGQVDAVAHDLHPDFHSTRVGQALARDLGVPALAVQHHLAHIGVVLAEQPVAGGVIGLALDGVGLGTDGTAWGGELLHVQGSRWARVGHLLPLALPGGDCAAREPWRMAAAALHALGRGAEIEARFGPQVGAASARGVRGLLERGLRCPVTTSAGRWFDAAAAALGLHVVRQQEAQAAMALEALAATYTGPPAAVPVPAAHGVIDLRPVLAEVLACADRGDPARGAACFHHSLGAGLAQAATHAAGQAGTTVVALGGGCFFNRLLNTQLTAALQAAGLQVLRPRSVCCGDAGLALGQAWVVGQMLAALPVPPSKETVPCA